MFSHALKTRQAFQHHQGAGKSRFCPVQLRDLSCDHRRYHAPHCHQYTQPAISVRWYNRQSETGKTVRSTGRVGGPVAATTHFDLFCYECGPNTVEYYSPASSGLLMRFVKNCWRYWYAACVGVVERREWCACRGGFIVATYEIRVSCKY